MKKKIYTNDVRAGASPFRHLHNASHLSKIRVAFLNYTREPTLLCNVRRQRRGPGAGVQTRKALHDHVDEEDKGGVKHDTLGGTQNVTIINESGLYALILSSKLSQAKTFKSSFRFFELFMGNVRKKAVTLRRNNGIES